VHLYKDVGIDLSRSWGINATHICDGHSIPHNNPLMYVNSISTEDTCKFLNVKEFIRNDGRITYVALRAIDVGEELIVSYGHDYFQQANYTRFECGMSAIAIAAARGDAGRVRDMIADRRREGKNVSSLVNARAHEWTPLHEASNRGHAEAIAALVEGGAIVDQAIQSNGKTSLTIASEWGHTGAVKVLLAAGASVKRTGNNGRTALMCACRNGHRDVAGLLLGRGADVGQARPDGWTAMMYASDGHRDVVELLLDRGADVGQAKPDGGTVLMLACYNGHRDVVELILDRGADVGQARKDGVTALMLACHAGHRDVAELLLDRGADVGQLNTDGTTALMLARHAERGDVVELLLSRGTQHSLHAADESSDHAELGSHRIAVRTST